jgi:hypothetical protein
MPVAATKHAQSYSRHGRPFEGSRLSIQACQLFLAGFNLALTFLLSGQRIPHPLCGALTVGRLPIVLVLGLLCSRHPRLHLLAVNGTTIVITPVTMTVNAIMTGGGTGSTIVVVALAAPTDAAPPPLGEWTTGAGICEAELPLP